MPQSILSNNYQNISLKLKESAKHFAEKSMPTVASKLRGAVIAADLGVSIDEISQRKCFPYLNGVITIISTDTGKSLILQFYPKVLKSVPKCRR